MRLQKYRAHKRFLRIADWSLGYLSETSSEPLKYHFVKYFSVQGFETLLRRCKKGFRLPSRLWFHPQEHSRKKKVELITELYDGYELKLEFSYKFVENVYKFKEWIVDED